MFVANDALRDEVEALHSIYSTEVLDVHNDSTAVLTLPNTAYSFSLIFSAQYPDEPPSITGTHHVDASARKGEGDSATNVLRDVLGRIYSPGQVCLFDLIEEAGPLLAQHHEAQNGAPQDIAEDPTNSRSARSFTSSAAAASESPLTAASSTTVPNIPPPNWILSESLVVNKSTFVARCLRVSSLPEATSSISNLVSTNKRVAGATHNITAWRIKTAPTSTTPEIVVQDCDDDGETAAGGRLLHLMQLMDVWNAVVVVTRWYGGVKLGPDRFRCINTVAREALLNGGFVKDEQDKGKGSGKKGKK